MQEKRVRSFQSIPRRLLWSLARVLSSSSLLRDHSCEGVHCHRAGKFQRTCDRSHGRSARSAAADRPASCGGPVGSSAAQVSRRWPPRRRRFGPTARAAARGGREPSPAYIAIVLLQTFGLVARTFHLARVGVPSARAQCESVIKLSLANCQGVLAAVRWDSESRRLLRPDSEEILNE